MSIAQYTENVNITLTPGSGDQWYESQYLPVGDVSVIVEYEKNGETVTETKILNETTNTVNIYPKTTSTYYSIIYETDDKISYYTFVSSEASVSDPSIIIKTIEYSYEVYDPVYGFKDDHAKAEVPSMLKLEEVRSEIPKTFSDLNLMFMHKYVRYGNSITVSANNFSGAKTLEFTIPEDDHWVIDDLYNSYWISSCGIDVGGSTKLLFSYYYNDMHYYQYNDKYGIAFNLYNPTSSSITLAANKVVFEIVYLARLVEEE